MYGVVTRTDSVLEWPEFDRAFYEMKSVSGQERAPVDSAVNMVACFADNATAADRPDLVPITASGEPATREQPYFDWSYICPTRDSYRTGLLDVIETAGRAGSGAVRLDDIGFPREEYCYCSVCEERFTASEYDDRHRWRTAVITDFVRDAVDLIPGPVYCTIYPDPYPGHLRQRSGVSIQAIHPYVDEFVIPLYDRTYSTTYWLEILASAFRDRIDGRLGIELYAAEAEFDRIVRATRVVSSYADSVYFGYDAGQARAAIRRIRADERPGVSHGRPDDDSSAG